MRFYFNDLNFVDKIDNDCYFDLGYEEELINKSSVFGQIAYKIDIGIWSLEDIDNLSIFTIIKNQEEYDQLNSEYTLFLLQKN